MEKYSFKSLFSKSIKIDGENEVQISKIEIPRIQRDYAQGRKEKHGENIVFNDKGLRFIESVFDKLKASEEMPLDFIYGALENGILLPLDGQQRLTTLFLLYWYIGNRELEDKTELTEMLLKFGYETRSSSRSFCEKLSKETGLSFEKNVSTQLKDMSWFAISYEQDPTIKSMLNMLDKIHELYGAEKQSLYENLEKLQFNVLPLNHFNLTDELYVKMNARGKALTDFENFKADFVGWMKEKWQDKSVEFAGKLDNVWTDIFWKNRSSDGKIDDIYFAFLNRYFLNVAIVRNMVKFDQSKIAAGEKYWYLYDNDSKNYKGFELYSDILGDSDLTERIDTIFNRVRDIEVIKYMPEWMKSDFSFIPVYVNKDDVELVSNITQPQRVLFYAICRYFETEEFDEVSFRQWMRVVCNLIENTTIGTIDAMIGRLKLIDELSEHSHNIYDFLANPETTISSDAAKDQMNEEKTKASMIQEDAKWEEKFIEAEKYAFFNGAIRFLFKDENGVTDWSNYDVKWVNAQKYFDEKGEGLNKEYNNVTLLKSVISRCPDFWGLIWWSHKIFNNSPKNWRELLLNKGWQKSIHHILIGDCTIAQVSDKNLQPFVEEGFLEYIIEKMPNAWIRNYGEYRCLWESGYPKNRIVLNHILHTLVKQNVIQYVTPIFNSGYSICQNGCIDFWYRDRKFRWQESNWVDMYEGDVKLWDRRAENPIYETLYTQLNGDTEYQFTDSDSLITELDRCINEYEALNQ